MSNFYFLKSGEVAKKLGVSTQTLRNWEKKGILVPIKHPTGLRGYSEKQVKEYIKSIEEGGTKDES